jgi:hypothetical protein
LERTRANRASSVNASRLAWEEYCQGLLCANELVYID